MIREYCFFMYSCKHARRDRETCKYGDLKTEDLKKEILKENGHSLPLQK